MATILLTGVTGAVGHVVACCLKRRGHRLICLIRGRHPAARLRSILATESGPQEACLTGDVTLPYADVSLDQIHCWRNKVDAILHLAGSVKFDNRFAAEIRRANLDGTRNMLTLAGALNVRRFHYMSTAYVAGNAATFAETETHCGQVHHNEYERSKLAAEDLVRRWPGDGAVHRLSIMVGDARTGETAAFNGYYGFFVALWKLRQSLWKRWTVNREQVKRIGVWFNDEGRLHLPLSIDSSPMSTLNLVPADWVAETVADLLDRAAPGATYHLVHPAPPRVRWVIETSLAHLGITGVRFGDCADTPGLDGSFLERFQKGLDAHLGQYRPYVHHGPRFTSDRLVQTLGDRYVSPPAVTTEFLATMLDYAVKHEFGRTIRVDAA